MSCNIKDCPRNDDILGECELSKLDKSSEWYTTPEKCTHKQ